MSHKAPPVPPLRLRQHPLALIRFSGFFLHVLVMYAAFRLITLGYDREHPTLIRRRQKMFRFWARTTLAFLGIRCSWSGTRPAPPALIASNHLGYMDVLILTAILSPRFLSKVEVASWPVLGKIVQRMGTLFIDRANRRELTGVIDQMSETLDHGESIVFFPEGTSFNGKQVLPLRSPLLQVAVSRGQPVIPVGIRYASHHPDFPAYRDICWWGDMPFFAHFYRFCAIPKVTAQVIFGKELTPESDRKAFAAELHQVISKLVRT